MNDNPNQLDNAIHELNNHMQGLSFRAAILKEQVGKISTFDLVNQTKELCDSVRMFVELSQQIQDLKNKRQTKRAA